MEDSPIKGAKSVDVINSTVICNSDYQSRVIESKSGEIVEEYPYEVRKAFPCGEYQIAMSRSEANRREVILLKQLTTDVWRKECLIGNNVYSFENRIFNTEYRNSRNLFCFDRDTFEKIWEFDVYPYGTYTDDIFTEGEKAGGTVRRIFCVYQDLPWVALINGRLIALDMFRGELKHKVGISELDKKRVKLSNTSQDWVPFTTNTSLDKESNRITGLCGRWFTKVDLTEARPCLNYIDVSESMDARGLTADYSRGAFPFDKRYIYFCDSKLGRIGLFNRAKETVVWSHDLDMDRQGLGQINSMEVMDDTWCILDRNKVLHVYKREQSPPE